MAHVPRFGDWDSENVPYTAYFENARSEKGSGRKMINPNDPEQNPEAFMFISGVPNHASEHKQKQRGENPNPPENRNATRAPRFRADSEKEMLVAKQQRKKHINTEEEDVFQKHKGVPARHKSVDHRGSLDPQRSRNRKPGKSESASDKSNSDYALLKSSHRADRSGQTRTSGEGSSSFTPSTEQGRMKSGNNRVGKIPQRVASVPKFGAWDESDPRSGDGFTVIFNKVKEEKQVGASKLPAIPAQATIYPNNGHRKRGGSKSKSKKCCGLF